MTRTTWISGLLTVVILASPSPLEAEESCEIENTIAECWQIYLPLATATTEATKDAVIVQEKEELKDAETGVDTSGAVTATNVKNFMPMMALSGLLGAEENDEEGTLSLDLNFLLPNRFREKNGQLQAVVDMEPSLYAPITGKLAEDTRDESVKKLEGGFGNYDDITVSFTLNLLTERFGRSFRRHAAQFEAFLERIEAENSETPTLLLDFIARHKGQNGSDQSNDPTSDLSFEEDAAAAVAGVEGGGDEELTFLDLAREDLEGSADEDAVRARAVDIMKEFEQAARQEAGNNQEMVAAMAFYRLPAFADLLDNQPQLHVSASKRIREDLAGPDELSVKITWEKPDAPNLAAFNRQFRERRATTCVADAEACLDDYREYVNKNEKAMTKSDRFSFSLEYSDTDALTLDLPEFLDEPFTVEQAEKLIVKAGWGRQLTESTRLDVDASWENVSNDPNRQDRGIATATLTRKVGDMSFPFSVVYATDSEFIDALDVDERVSMHVGIKYSLTSDSSPD